MKTNSDFKPDDNLALLLLGAPGAGKTNVGMEFPDPYFVDWTDSNMKSAVERHPGKTFYFDRVDVDDKDQPVAADRRWERGETLLKTATKNPAIKTIVDDSLSMMQVALCDHLVRIGGQAENPLMVGGMKVMTKSLWGPFQQKILQRVIEARASGKYYVMICHEAVEGDEMTGIKIYKVKLSGGLQGNLAALFTDFWACETDPGADKKQYPTGVRYFVRTAPTNKMKLKCSCGLPAELEFTWDNFLRLRGTVGGVKAA